MDNIFKLVSRYIIFIPIGIVVIAFVLRFNTQPEVKVADESLRITPTLVLTLMPSAVPTPSFNIDLVSQQKCGYSTADKTVTAYIKNRNVEADITTSGKTAMNVITDDCLYQWTDGELQGQKMCGMTNMLSLLETLNNMGIVSQEIIQQSPRDDSVVLSPQELLQILSTCSKAVVEDANFDIPKNIQFTEVANPIK